MAENAVEAITVRSYLSPFSSVEENDITKMMELLQLLEALLKRKIRPNGGGGLLLGQQPVQLSQLRQQPFQSSGLQLCGEIHPSNQQPFGAHDQTFNDQTQGFAQIISQLAPTADLIQSVTQLSPSIRGLVEDLEHTLCVSQEELPGMYLFQESLGKFKDRITEMNAAHIHKQTDLVRECSMLKGHLEMILENHAFWMSKLAGETPHQFIKNQRSNKNQPPLNLGDQANVPPPSLLLGSGSQASALRPHSVGQVNAPQVTSAGHARTGLGQPAAGIQLGSTQPGGFAQLGQSVPPSSFGTSSQLPLISYHTVSTPPHSPSSPTTAATSSSSARDDDSEATIKGTHSY